ncbi:hypothetical protein M407DRAFT_244477 [Tulasnella calospora MUT 4182]|uniref:Uncharacterized protein n=1 Tax=Tulasnella calospora MUT 4182 TaxID=1051891 RepID=A0A0C3QG63_9AGAM|nr:hypothetical protein M407DRAFT_244477 [Tulasnella calospora MUT 4182]
MKLDEGTAHSFAARGSQPIALHHNRSAPSNSVGTSTELAWNTRLARSTAVRATVDPRLEYGGR